MSKNDIVLQLSWAMGCIGLIAFILNVLVIVRILYQGLRTIHKSKVFIFSLSFADGIFSFGAIIHCLMRQEEIKLKSDSDRKIASLCIKIIFGLAFVSSLLHITFITADRLVAIKYPFQHNIQFTHTRILKALAGVWLCSIFITSTHFWTSLVVIDWVVTVGITLASCICIITYAYIGVVTSQRKKTFTCTQYVTQQQQRALKSMKTTYLSCFITIAYIVCNAPFAIANIIQRQHWDPLVSMIVYMLITVNTMVDPIIYTLLEVCEKRLSQRKSTSDHVIMLTSIKITKQNSTNSNMMTEDKDYFIKAKN